MIRYAVSPKSPTLLHSIRYPASRKSLILPVNPLVPTASAIESRLCHIPSRRNISIVRLCPFHLFQSLGFGTNGTVDGMNANCVMGYPLPSCKAWNCKQYSLTKQ